MNLKKTLAILIIIFSHITQAGVEAPTSSSLTYQGRILRPDGTALEHSNVSFLFQITDPTGQCTIYQEHVSGINMSNSKGIFDISIGTGTVSWPQIPSNILEIFNNGITHICGSCSGYTCNPASTYTPQPSDGRFLVVSFHDGVGWKKISPSTSIRSVPFAGYAQSAQKLGSFTANDFVLKSSANDFILKSSVNNSTSCASGKFLTWNAANSTFGCDTPTSSASTMGGDILGTSSAATVDKIQSTPVVISGLTSNHVLKYSGGNWVNSQLTTSDISNLATTLSDYVTFSKFASCGADNTLTYSSPTGGFICTPIAISGSQVSGDLTGNLTGNVTGSASLNVLKAGDTMTGNLTFNSNNLGTVYKSSTANTASVQGPSGAITTSYILRLPTGTPSSSGQALVSDTLGNLSWQSLSSGSIDLASGVTGVLPVASGGTGVSSFTNNRLIASDTTGKLSSFNAGATNAILQQGASGPSWTTAAYPTNTTAKQLLYSSSDNNITGLATANSSVLTTDTTGVPSFKAASDDLFSQYALLDGRTASQTLNGGNTANGTLTLSSTSHSTKGNIILNPNGGNVGVGTVNPATKLHVNGGVARISGTGSYLLVKADASSPNHLSYPTGTVASFENETASQDVIMNLFGYQGKRATINFGVGNSITTAGAIHYSLNTNINDSMEFQVSGGSRMKITGAGNVGIGTPSPAAKLDVMGDVKIGNSATACSSTVEGSQRYNSTSKEMEFCNGTSWSSMRTGLTQRQTFTTPGSFSFTVPAGVTQLRAYIAGAGGGGSSLDSSGNSGGNTTFNSVTAFGGSGGKASAGPGAVGGSGGGGPGAVTGADIPLVGGGAYGGTGAQRDGGWGGLGIKTFSVTPGQVLTGSVGAYGEGATSGDLTGQNGSHGYVIIEYSGGATTASSGSGTTNYIPVWTGTTTLGNSPIVVSSGNIGIGTTDPVTQLDIRGSSVVGRTTSANSVAYSILYNDTGLQSMGMQKRGTTAVSNMGLPAGSAEIYSAGSPLGIYANNSPSSYVAIGGGTGSGSVEHMRVTNSGNIGIGTSNPNFRFHVLGPNGHMSSGPGNAIAMFTSGASANSDYLAIGSPTEDVMAIHVGDSSSARHLALNPQGGFVGIGNIAPAYKLDVTGDLRITGTPYRNGGDVGWTVPSDQRLKDITSTYDNGLEELSKIHTIKFRYKEGNAKGISSSEEYTGVIAQEVQKHIPEAVKEDKDGFLSLNTTPIFWSMVNAIKELYSLITNVQSDTNHQAREIASLKEENARKDQELKAIKSWACSKDPEASFCK